MWIVDLNVKGKKSKTCGTQKIFLYEVFFLQTDKFNCTEMKPLCISRREKKQASEQAVQNVTNGRLVFTT